MSLWTDDRTPREPDPQRQGSEPPAAPTRPAATTGSDPSRDPRRGRWLAALGGGTVSAVVVSAVLLGTGIADNDQPATAPSGNSTAPVSISASDSKGDLVRTVYNAASPSVASIRTGSGSGTGFLVDSNGTIVTNAHVVGDSDQVQVRFNDKGEYHEGRVLSLDASTDLAAVKVDPSDAQGIRPLELADSATVRTGQLAVAIGSPFGLPQTATAGIVSGTGRHIQAPDGFQIDSVIQTDAPINPGNSGGPLLDANGRVIGVNSQIQTGGSGNGNVGIGFAVPANTVRDVIPRLERGETIRRPYLGVSTAPGDGGALVREATAGGPAAAAGVRAGDLIVSVGGTAVREPDDVAAAIQDRRPGQRIALEIERGADRRSLEVELAARPERGP